MTDINAGAFLIGILGALAILSPAVIIAIVQWQERRRSARYHLRTWRR